MRPPYRRPGKGLYGPVFTNTVHSECFCFCLRQSPQTPRLKLDSRPVWNPVPTTEPEPEAESARSLLLRLVPNPNPSLKRKFA